MNEQKVALITGVTGQDGAHLAAHLVRDGWRVYGGFRRGSSSKTWRLEALGIVNQVELVEFQLSELSILYFLIITFLDKYLGIRKFHFHFGLNY